MSSATLSDECSGEGAADAAGSDADADGQDDGEAFDVGVLVFAEVGEGAVARGAPFDAQLSSRRRWEPEVGIEPTTYR
jgi:hypothetical protein